VQSIEDYSNKKNIEYIGIRYSYLDEKVNSFNKEISDFQKKSFENSLIFNEDLLKIK
jgi:hypothetical protein